MATNFFVTQSGAGASNGTSLANAWSISQFNATSTPTGGDTVFFSGTITSTISLSAGGTGVGASLLTLDFSGSCGGCTVVTFSSSITNNLFDFNNHSFVYVKGGGFNGVGGASWSPTAFSPNMFMCKLPNGTAETAHDLTIDGFTYRGYATDNGDFYQGGLCSNVLLVNNYADNVGHMANIFQSSVANGITNITIRNNFGRTSLDTTTDDDVIQIGGTTGVLIEGNMLINRSPGGGTCCHNDGTQGQNHPNSNWIFRYNWVQTAQTTSGASGSGVQFMEMEGFFGQPALQIYSNVYQAELVPQPGGNEGVSIHHGQNASDTYFFYNNTLWTHQWPNSFFVRLGEGDGPGTAFIENNAVGTDLNTTGNTTWQTTFTAGAASHNFQYQAVTGCPGTCTAMTPSAFVNINTGCSANTPCSDNFAESANSVLLNAGDSTIGAAYNQGICPGATWPNPMLCQRSPGNWDVGAYQSGNTLPAPPTNLTATPGSD